MSVRRAIRLGLYTADDPTPYQLAADMDDNLFANIIQDKTDHTYNLRSPRHFLSH